MISNGSTGKSKTMRKEVEKVATVPEAAITKSLSQSMSFKVLCRFFRTKEQTDWVFTSRLRLRLRLRLLPSHHRPRDAEIRACSVSLTPLISITLQLNSTERKLEEAEKLDGGGRRSSFTRWRRLDEQTSEEAG
ncbi:hypothetical protein DY000_02017128 [Brassica cretica]|uniref:Uncharacterized protein n=1 Tax=Brassica cretica TaxID=69181 RepID=A0ABQ7CQK4_BRACR|nr:hypothetical protein DY000_02017128 [Brassica cretica]